MRKLFFTTAVGSFFCFFTAQSQSLKSQLAGNPGMYPSLMEFEAGDAPSFSKGSVSMPGANGTWITVPGVQLLHEERDQAGQAHLRYQQFFNSIPVENAVLIQHVQNNKVFFQNGKMVRDFPGNITLSASLSAATALAKALAFVHATRYKWEIPEEEAFIKAEQGNPAATFYPEARLVYYSGEEDVIPSALHLSFKFDIYAAQPMSRQLVFVDARTGAILGKREMIHETNAAGSAVTAYSGTQAITSDLNAGIYRLRETGRGNGIQTFNLKTSTNYAAAVDFTDADNTWNNVNTARDQYATDAHWGAEKTYDFYFSRFGRNSIDNAGFAIKSYVHYSTNYFNAFWDGSRMTYGDGDASDGNKPLTALDVCGHEISHGLTSFTSNLNYSGESGAMNEGFSDIFGTSIEFYARPSNANWLIGSDFYTIRSMSNPNQYGDPDTYKGTNWYAGTGDNGGVHTNSGVLNFWFYLLSIGGSGTNDKGTAFNVTGIGVTKAAAIAYRLNTFYLVSTSNYANARTFGIKAAEDLYGVGSAEATQTANAWLAVGVGTVVTPTCSDVYEANESISAAKTIGVNTDILAKISSTTDQDYFVFTTTTASPKVKVTLSGLPADYDIRLYNSTGTQLGISQLGGTNAETINYNTATVGATYYVRVYGYGGVNSTSCYTLRASISGTSFIDETITGDKGIIAMQPAVTTEWSLTLKPVPAVDFTTISFSSRILGKAEITVAGVNGAVVRRLQVSATTGINQVRLDVSALKPGMYIVKLDNGDRTQIQKLVVQH